MNVKKNFKKRINNNEQTPSQKNTDSFLDEYIFWCKTVF